MTSKIVQCIYDLYTNTKDQRSRNVRLYYPNRQSTNLLTSRFLSLLCLRSTLYVYIYIYIYIYMPIASKVLYMKWCRIRVFIHDAVFKPIQLVYHIHFMPFSNDFHTGIVYRRKTNRTLFHIVFIQSYWYRVNGVMYTALHIGSHFMHFISEHTSLHVGTQISHDNFVLDFNSFLTRALLPALQAARLHWIVHRYQKFQTDVISSRIYI